MSGGNYVPWIVLGVIVLASLWWKGYLNFDQGGLKIKTSCPECGPKCDCSDCKEQYYGHDSKRAVTSHELGLAYHRRSRRKPNSRCSTR